MDQEVNGGANYNAGHISGCATLRGVADEAVEPGAPVTVTYCVGRRAVIELVNAKSMRLAYVPTNALRAFTPSTDIP